MLFKIHLKNHNKRFFFSRLLFIFFFDRQKQNYIRKGHQKESPKHTGSIQRTLKAHPRERKTNPTLI